MKARRQKKIREIITNEVIKTQEDLAGRLLEEGFAVTQATISRDIKEMGLVKVPSGGDEYRYALRNDSLPISYQERLKRMLKEVVVSYDYSENIVVVKTIPGNVQALALLFDNADWKVVIGSVAGDDTIFLLVKPKEAVKTVLERLYSMI